jgi:electron transfer flavoprotein beta subunit
VDSENFIETYEVSLPIVLSFSKESKLKLPYIKFEDINKDVQDKLHVIDNSVLNFEKKQVGLEGSLTKVIRSFVKQFDKKEKLIVQCDEEGVSSVYRFLKQLGYIK